ncbi:ligand-binding sensor domain-containing diguanylate cyclase [Sphingomonas fuzhouensis]|uniref:ligand-binding sensor domain-containing diguanylate cyclase n=1 Tax=Sphingomonas fuzhouensis TaxID=3106033 RepID=UPI002AFE8E59|nr:diguanylate cyclase [Sphingomonas sp. SGZ-02]
MLFLCLPSVVRGEARDPWAAWQSASFTRLGDAVSLPHVTATAIVRASDGTMWIGTRGGLSRYDGQRVRSFRQRQSDPFSLPDNYVRSLLALPDGGLLIGTNVGGPARYDPASGRFIRLKALKGRIGTRIFGFAPDGAGGAYVASDGGIHHYVAGSDRIDPMTAEAIKGADGRRQVAFAVHRDADGTLWAGCEDGLWVRPAGTRRFVPTSLHHEAGDQDIWSILRDRQGRLWIGTGSDGLYMSTDRDWRPRFTQMPILTGAAPLIGHRTIRALVEDGRGRIWIGTDGKGIILLDPVHGFAAIPLRHLSANPLSLPGDTVRALALDGSDGVWAATEMGAARTQGPGGGTLHIGSAMPDPGMSLSDDNVRGIMVDRHDRIWLGYSNGMVDRLDRAAGQVRRLTLHGQHGGQDIKALKEAADGTILVGARGVVTIDPRTLAQRPLEVKGLGDLPVISLAETPDALLIGTYKGLFVRRRSDGQVRVFEHDAADPHSLPNNEVINIVVQPGGVVLIATPGGVGRMDLASGRFTNFSSRSGEPGSLPQDYAGSIIPTGRNIWVGTYGGVALGHAVPGGWHFHAVTEAQGLAGDNVASLILDTHGRPWVASAGGISVIDRDGRTVRVMSQRDGLGVSAFNQRAVARTADGSLLFGAPDGLVVLQPDLLLGRLGRHNAARLIVSSADIDGHALDSSAKQLALQWGIDGRTLRIDFALADYDAPDEIRYSYRLEGFDRNWMIVPAGTPASATYTNLPAGHYWLELRAHIPGLAAQTITRRVRVDVDPQWYETWPARIAMAALVLLAIGVAFLLVTAVIRRRARMLEKMVEERTSALRAANEQLDRLASTDPLTGLANRRTLMGALQGARDHAMNDDDRFAFALLDIDHFKRINDGFGHATGDEVLVAVASSLKEGVRLDDIVARYGGEEIAILFPGATLDAAIGIVERLRIEMAAEPVVVGHQRIGVTFSAGVTEWLPGEDVAAMIRRADAALYGAKRGGRDQVARAA